MSSIDPVTLTARVLDSYGVDASGGARVQDGTTVSDKLGAYLSNTTVDLSSGDWVALGDTISDVRVVTLAQVERAVVDELVVKLGELKTLVDGSTQLTEGSEAHEQFLDSFDRLEGEISTLIGRSSIKTSATLMVDDDTGEFEVRNTGSYVEALSLTGKDGETTKLAMIEISQDDFLNGFHFPDGCPICRAAMATEEAAGASGPELDYTATTNTSNGSAVDSSVAASGVNYIDPLLKQRKWDLQDGETLSYSFYLGDGVVPYTASYAEPYEQHSVEIPDAQKDELRAAYATWSTYAPFTFEEVTETASGLVVGDLRNAYINRYTGDDLAGTAAFAYYPYASLVGGDTWYVEPTAVTTNATFADDTYGRMTALHEIGHSIGLSHPFDGGSGSGETLTGNGLTDTMRQTVMSYTRSDYVTYYESSGSLASKNIYSNTPMIYDVAAVEYLYGAITDANTGDTTYSFGDTDHQRIKTIVDSGGTDTIDLSNSRHRSIVDLTPGSLSSVGYATESEQEAYWAALGYSLASVQSFITSTQLFQGNDNLGIAFSATIENIVGSSGDDDFTGNTADNKITGGQGNDTIDGGAGNDLAIFSGDFTDYTITDNNDGTYTVTDSESGRDGTDTVSNVEQFKFANLLYTVATGATSGGEAARGGSNGGAVSHVYYSAFNRINFGSSVMSAHQVAELKQLMFHSVGDVSDLIEEALRSFTQQRGSIDNVLATFSGTDDVSADTDLGPQTAAGMDGLGVADAQALAQQIRASIIEQVAEALDAQSGIGPGEALAVLS